MPLAWWSEFSSGCLVQKRSTKMLLATFVLILVNAVALNMDGLCPASSSLSTELHGLYTYPVDIFFPEQFKLLKGSSNIVTCTSKYASYNHSCAIDFKKCPITMDTVELATRRARNWTPENSFCELRDYMSSYDEVVNIIIFGGSVTVGHDSEGCHCESDVDGRCKFKKFFPNQEDKEKSQWPYNGYCRWSIPLARGLRSMSLAKVRVFNFGNGGTESTYSADGMLDWFRKFNLVPSGRDIIFVDHSTNDAMFIYDDLTAHRALVGVENLIRNLYHLSDPVSPPNIVLLAQYPGMSKERGQPLHDYQAMYAQVAAHYKVPLWSLRDVGYALTLRAAAEPATVAAAAAGNVTASATNSAAATAALRSYVPYLRNEFIGGGVHPAWFVHLYMADLYLSILYSEMSKCFSNPAVLNQPRVTAVNAAAAAAAASENAGDAAHDHLLPDRITNTSIVYCNAKSTYALSVSAEQGEGAQTAGTVLAPASWPVVTERNGKVGWVSEFKTTASASIIEPPPQLIFEFFLDTTKQHDSWLLDMKYLRTYENAGIASISLCGQPLKTYTYGGPAHVDALWADPVRFRFSETATFGIPLGMREYCTGTANKDPERAARGVGALVFTHERVNCASVVEAGEKSRCEARRSTQKMKLVSMTLCAV